MNKIGAIWARISTPEQASLESQIVRAKAKLEAQGYTVPAERILAADWTSLDLFSCPCFQSLRQWVERKEIQAIGLLDRDRLEADGLQRLEFLADCRAAGVELVICQGTPILEGDEGQLVELALTIGKKRSVLRAKQGAKDGLHDRAVIKRLPTSHHKVYGYKWDGKTPEELKLSRRLVADRNYPALKLIFDMALQGKTYDPIIKELKKRAIVSPDGMDEWVKATISSILHNPVYAGRYYALKKEAVQPVTRKGVTYGNSSCRKLPLEQAEYLPEIEVVNPPITWEQRGQILHQLEVHQKLAKRNGRADYLLRGFISCETHLGKKGEPRRYHGQPHSAKWRYVCPVGGCAHPNLEGLRIESIAKEYTRYLLEAPPRQFYEVICNQQNRDELEQSLRSELRTLSHQGNDLTNAETQLLLDKDVYKKDISEEAFRRALSIIQAKRQWKDERTEALNDQLAQLDRQAEAAVTLEQIQASIVGRLDELTKAQWRELFTALNLEIHIRDETDRRTWSEEWLKEGVEYLRGDWWIDICFGIPLIPTPRVKEIALNAPEPG